APLGGKCTSWARRTSSTWLRFTGSFPDHWALRGTQAPSARAAQRAPIMPMAVLRVVMILLLVQDETGRSGAARGRGGGRIVPRHGAVALAVEIAFGVVRHLEPVDGRRDLPRDGFHDIGGDDDDELRLLPPEAVGAEQRAEDRNVAEARKLLQLALDI